MSTPYIFTLDKYIIDQKLLALRDTYIIKDFDGTVLGKATRKLLSFGPRITITDSEGNIVGRLEGKALSLHRDIIFIDWQGASRGTLKKKVLKFIGSEYWFEDTSGEKKYRVKGNFTHHNYKVLDYVSDEVLAEVGKKWLSMRDSYAIMILDKEKLHPFVAIGIALAIDVVEYPGR